LGKVNGNNILFYKEKNYIPKDIDLRQDIAKMFHDHETAGHPGELKHLTQYAKITGGQDFEHSSRIMFRDVAFANNSKSIDIHPNLVSIQQKAH
jgi:hypothetical protein